MVATVNRLLPLLLRAAYKDLQPFDGRLGMAWRVAAQCMIASAIFMTYGIPLAAIGCYLIIFILKPDSMESSIMAIGITVLVSIVVAIMFALVSWTIDAPLLRMAVLVGASVLFLYIGAASQLGPAGNIIALVIAFIMTLLSDVPFGEVATRGLLYAWLMVAVPMGVVIVFNLFFGRSSRDLLHTSLAARLQATADVLAGRASPATLQAFLQEGNEALHKQVMLTKLLHLAPTQETRILTQAIPASYRLLLAASGVQADTTHTSRQEQAAQCEAAAQALRNKQVTALQQLAAPIGDKDGDTHEADAIDEALAALAATDTPKQKRETAEDGFFYPDALSNPTYLHYAVRTTAAAVICYLVYTALDWQDIHTAMVTCYVAALGSTAETVHKLVLRIMGCLIGAALGIAAILFVIPHITSITSFMLLVFTGVVVGGWVAAGSERISYAGIQIGLAFLLTVLQGFGPDVDVAVATDRVIGILLGNFVMFVLFTKLWPVSIMSSIKPGLAKALNQLATLTSAGRHRADPNTEDLASIMAELHRAREAMQLIVFEPRKLHPVEEEISRVREAIDKAGDLCRLTAFQGSRQTPQYQEAVCLLPTFLRTVRQVGQ